MLASRTLTTSWPRLTTVKAELPQRPREEAQEEPKAKPNPSQRKEAKRHKPEPKLEEVNDRVVDLYEKKKEKEIESGFSLGTGKDRFTTFMS